MSIQRQNAALSASTGALLAVLFMLLASAGAADACTTFCLRDGQRVVFGKNYDWNVADGHLLINPRGLARRAYGNAPTGAHWTSRFGSVSFNQYGRDFPSGGINEAGLVVELMWLSGSEYPKPDARAEIGSLQWIQYQLDNAATVEEVIASDAEIRISSRSPLHYLVADIEGRVATVEFLDGEMVVHSGDTLPFPALTNSRYDQSRAFLSDRLDSPLPRGSGSLDRFARAARRVQAFPQQGSEDPVRYAFETLQDVAQGDQTQWSIVYEMAAPAGLKRVSFVTLNDPRVRHLDLADIDFGCTLGARSIDLHQAIDGDLAPHLRPLDRDSNRQLISSSYRQTPFLANLPPSAIDRAAAYPDSARCAVPSR